MTAGEMGTSQRSKRGDREPEFEALAAGLDGAAAEIHRLILEAADEAFRQLETATGDSLRELMTAAGVEDLKGACLRGADLRGEDLSKIDFEGADLREADLREADLAGANLKHVRLEGARLDGAFLAGAKFSDPELAAEFSHLDASLKAPSRVRSRSLRSGPIGAARAGLDQLREYLEKLLHGKAKQFADFEFKQLSGDRYRLSFDVPGLEEPNFELAVRNNQLILSGRLPEERKPGSAALRLFERQVPLDDFIRVASTELKEGVLIVELVREVRQKVRPRSIAVPLTGDAREVEAGIRAR